MIRHLLYDCCALRDNTFPWLTHPKLPSSGSREWKLNIEKLCSYASVFTGRKIVVLRVGDIVHEPEEVKPYFEALGADVEFVERPNQPFPGLREAGNFIENIGLLKPTGPNESIFFAHTKGVARGGTEIAAIRKWRDTMYEKCLENPERIDAILQTAATCGCYRVVGPPAGCPRSKWHFSGTFWWINSNRLFELPGWDDVPHTPYAVEGYPGIMFNYGDSVCLHEDNPKYSLYTTVAEYRCDTCDHIFEARRKFHEQPLKICPKCYKRKAVMICTPRPML